MSNEWSPVRMRTFTFRALAIALILFLLSVGMVSAETICDGSCTCHSKGPLHGMPGGFPASPSGSLHLDMANHLLQGPRLSSFSDILFPNAGCHDGTTEVCDMEAPRTLYALQGSVSAVPWSEHYVTVDSILFVSVINPNKNHSPGPAINHWVIGRKAPDPLYLQHLSLLC